MAQEDFSTRPTFQGLKISEPSEEPEKNRSHLLCASDSGSDDEMGSMSSLNLCKAEPSFNMEQLPLQWWSTHARACLQRSALAHKNPVTPALMGDSSQATQFIRRGQKIDKLVNLSNWQKEKRGILRLLTASIGICN